MFLHVYRVVTKSRGPRAFARVPVTLLLGSNQHDAMSVRFRINGQELKLVGPHSFTDFSNVVVNKIILPISGPPALFLSCARRDGSKAVTTAPQVGSRRRRPHFWLDDREAADQDLSLENGKCE